LSGREENGFRDIFRTFRTGKGSFGTGKDDMLLQDMLRVSRQGKREKKSEGISERELQDMLRSVRVLILNRDEGSEVIPRRLAFRTFSAAVRIGEGLRVGRVSFFACEQTILRSFPAS